MSVTRVDVSAADAAEVLEAAKELQELTGSTQPTETQVTETPAVTPAATTATETPANTPAETPANTPAATTVDLDSAAQEFISTGALTPETITALEAKGFTKAQAEIYAAGVKAQAAEITNKLAERVGGAEALDTMREWAKKGGFTETEQAAFSAMVTSGNESQMALALDGLAARYERAVGVTPERVSGANVVNDNTPKPFESNAQIVAAMQDPKYKADPAYRAAIAARLAASNTFSTRAY